MANEHLVVDGSNIATEGRSEPSLDQLESAVGELHREFPDLEITVVVDATFSHRIAAGERARYDQAMLAGSYVQPPAGAIGRGDAFLLRIAEKVDAVVCSNDSFQEFHAEHPWLFDRGRLIGATPVAGVGWIFSPRIPVRGPTSHRAVRSTDRERKKVTKAIEVATKEATSKPVPARTATAVNDPLTFVSFIAEHPLGAEVEGVVESYTSHGAVVSVGAVQCYLPLAGMGDPAPRSARDVVKLHEHRVFVVRALDAQRRGVELAVPGVGPVSGRPSEAMIEAEVKIAKRAARKAAAEPAKQSGREPAKKAAAPAKKAAGAPAKKAAGAPAKKAAAPAKKAAAAPAKKAAAAPAKKAVAPAKSAAAKATRKAAEPAKKAAEPAKKAAEPAKKVAEPAKKAAEPAKKAAAPAKKAAAAPTKKAAPAPVGSSGSSSGSEAPQPRRNPRRTARPTE
jgi:hypothetical protein